MKAIFDHSNYISTYNPHSPKDPEPRRTTLCAVKKDGKVYLGTACCSEKDQFTKERGRNIAMARAMAGGYVQARVWNKLKYRRQTFLYRAMRYFKDVPAKDFTWEVVED